MSRNKMIDALEQSPCTSKELPYRICGYTEFVSHKQILKIKPAGTRTNTRVNRCGRLRNSCK